MNHPVAAAAILVRAAIHQHIFSLNTTAGVRFLVDIPPGGQPGLVSSVEPHQGFVLLYEILAHHQPILCALQCV